VARTAHADLGFQGQQALLRAVRSLGHRAESDAGHAATDLTVTVDGLDIRVEIKAASVITPESAKRMIAEVDRRGTTVAHVAVGDLITSAAQDALRRAGWGWLDRRGHLVLRAKGVHIDADVPADERPLAGTPAKPISGAAAVSWAAALLMSPDDPPAIRKIARTISISHSAIVNASRKLKDASLVQADGRPLVPELFWALADEWHSRAVALATLPPVGEVAAYGLGVNVAGNDPGWAVAGTVGASVWGAPLAIGSAYPPDFYVASAAELRQATLRLGEASRFEDRACTVAIAPTPLVCLDRYDRESNEWGQWRFAHGLFAALDLAQDRARGAEILADWQPKDFTRVW
jgi:hypothetical protein